MKKTILVLCVILMSAFYTESKGQTATFKALFLFNFTKNFDWPASAQSNEVVITVFGDDEVRTELEKIAKVKKAGNRTIKVVSAKSINDVDGAHIVFLGSGKSSQMPTLSAAQKGKPVLLVADKKGLCKQGACISFLTVDGKLRYEVCESEINSHQLKVTQKIISLGIKIQ